jgi:hypothetical protein
VVGTLGSTKVLKQIRLASLISGSACTCANEEVKVAINKMAANNFFIIQYELEVLFNTN